MLVTAILASQHAGNAGSNLIRRIIMPRIVR